jgi:cytochrome c oxidase subunit II
VRRGAIVRVVTIALLAAAVATAVALFIPWLPPLRSEQGERIDFVLWFTVAICIGVFAVVAAISVYSVAKFRVRPDDDSDGPPIHGHTGIEIAWTAIPTILVTVIAVVSAVALAENGKLKEDRVVIEVTARQFVWTFAYPPEAEAVSAPTDELLCKLPPETPNCPVSGILRLPEGRQVELRLRALDVIHSFWVPEFRQKQDAVPGIVTRVAITPTEPGEHSVVCTELCGLGHALMRAGVIVMREGEFDRWRSQQEQELQGNQG